ncbi:MAG: hypothetical protein JWM71_950 [Solirubrobacteraceae bacterium]|nr:hypothetical protein [Solirubrobacteraceae bacterium]
MPSIRRSLIAAVLATAVVPASASATDVHNIGEFQDAGTHAASGTTIHVFPGVYQGSVTVANAGVTVQADPGSLLVSASGDSGPTLTFSATSGTPADVVTGLDVVNTVAAGAAAISVGAPGLTVQRVLALSVKGDAVSSAATSGAADRTITVDSSMLFATAGSAVHATSSGAGVGTTTVAGHHVTAVGLNAINLDSSGANGVPSVLPPGNIAATFADSIMLGHQLSAANSTAGTGNTATIAETRDISHADASSAATLFVSPAKGNYHLRADSPAIGQGGFTSGESATDIDGDAIPTSASDVGADQFVNRAPTAVLAAVSGTPRQNAPVTFDASKSSDPDAAIGGGITAYHWNFGDGQTATTSTPTTTHSYAAKQAYSVTVTVTDKQGATSAPSGADTFTVLDGVPPTITVAKPTAKQKIALYRTRKGKHGKVIHTKTRLAVSFLGSASDDVALSKVILALRPVASKNGVCRWFDGKTSLKAGSCTAPLLLSPSVINGGWRYSLPLKAKLPVGAYDLYAIAVDSSGLASAAKIISFRLR